MMDDELVKTLANQSAEAIGEAYKDLAKPSFEPIGQIISYPFRALRLAFGPIEKWLSHQEASLKMAADAVAEKTKDIPEEKIVPLEPYIAVPAVMQLSYCENSDELRDLYANLLASSMNVDKKWQVHPAFVDIIKQLNPDEARYLKTITPNSVQIYPLIDVDFSIGDGNGGGHPIITNFTDYHLDVLENPQNICSYIDNLVRLNIIEIPFGQWVDDINKYKSLENHPMIKNPVKGDQSQIHYKYRHKLFKLTNFGVNLLNVVCH